MKKRSADKGRGKGLTRRGFMTTMGVGVFGVAASGRLLAGTAQAAETNTLGTGDMKPIRLRVNGRDHRLLVEARWSLLFVLREVLGLAATKEGCGRGECGACTVLIDGIPRYACMTLAVEAESREVTTLEGLMNGEALGPVQKAFAEKDAFQCGYCTPGQIMAAEGLLRSTEHPSVDDIRLGMSGNLCRCGAYVHIVEAVQAAAAERKK